MSFLSSLEDLCEVPGDEDVVVADGGVQQVVVQSVSLDEDLGAAEVVAV